MSSNNKKAMIIAILAGILLFISGISGGAVWRKITKFVIENITDNYIIQIIFIILVLIASLGGISVIFGGFLIGKNKILTGKIFITLGTGIGLIGLLIIVSIAIIQHNISFSMYFSIGVIGIISSPLSRIIEWVWMKLAHILNSIFPPILLGIVFFLFLYPISLISKLFTKDPLMLAKKYNTYFVDITKEIDKESLERRKSK